MTLYYMGTNSFIIHIQTKVLFGDIPKDVEKMFDTANSELERPLPKGKNKKVIGLMKDQLGGKTMK